LQLKKYICIAQSGSDSSNICIIRDEGGRVRRRLRWQAALVARESQTRSERTGFLQASWLPPLRTTRGSAPAVIPSWLGLVSDRVGLLCGSMGVFGCCGYGSTVGWTPQPLARIFCSTLAWNCLLLRGSCFACVGFAVVAGATPQHSVRANQNEVGHPTASHLVWPGVRAAITCCCSWPRGPAPRLKAVVQDAVSTRCTTRFGRLSGADMHTVLSPNSILVRCCKFIRPRT
jgi:hypothetical protein